MSNSVQIPGLRDFVHAPINRGDLTEEADKCHGYHASVVEILAMVEFKEAEMSLKCDQARNDFADTIAAEKGKVSEAALNREVVRYEPWIAARTEYKRCGSDQTLLKGLKINLEIRHQTVIALINRSNAEIRAQHV